MTPIPLGILDFPTGAAGAYDLLETQILTSSAASVTFTGLDTLAAGYKHLQIRAIARQDDSSDYRTMAIRFNGDTGSNYAFHYLSGDGSSVSSSGGGSQISIQTGASVGTATTGLYGASIIDILDFSSTTKNTTIRGLDGAKGSVSGQVRLTSGLWNSTAAVTSITLGNYAAFTKNFLAGSRFSLYGVK